ncbi:MAG: ribbon-helix-helix protein, CopG family [Candidatus Latescibacteria bacterium]|nr:ribbon-helix-helix protein, CopG family [Candidatus Latescibacterota bacterium]
MARVNIMLPDDLLRQIDEVARTDGMNRSQLLRTAVQAYFAERQQKRQQRQRQTDIEQAMALQDALRQRAEPWDPLAFLHRVRQGP